MLSDSLTIYLVIAAALLFIGIYGMLQHRTLIGMLISSEFILNGAAVNFMAFNRFVIADPAIGQAFALFIMGIAAAEAAIAVSLIIAVYRKFKTTDPEAVCELRY